MNLEEVFKKETKNKPGTLEQKSSYTANYIAWLETIIEQLQQKNNKKFNPKQAERCSKNKECIKFGGVSCGEQCEHYTPEG